MTNVVPFKRPEPQAELRRRRGSKAHDVQVALLIIEERAEHMEKAARDVLIDAARIRELVREAWKRLGYRPLNGHWPDDPPAAS